MQARHPVIFAGAGPGAADRITVRALEALRKADLVIYAGSLVNEDLLREAPHAETRSSAGMTLDQVISALAEAYDKGLRAVRLHTGDPAIYGAVAEQFRELDRRGIPYEVIPGVSSVFAAAASLKTEFTMSGLTQTAILTRFAGKTPVPEKENAALLASHGSTLCFFLSAGALKELALELIRGGRSPETPAAVVSKASWPDEKIVRGTLQDIAEKACAAGIRRHAVIVVGEVLEKSGESSRLYANTFTHGFRDPGKRFRGRVALLPVTEQGFFLACDLASGLECAEIFATREISAKRDNPHVRIRTRSLAETAADLWTRYDGIVFICASGIAVRSIAPLCRSKTEDPAVVQCDERGDYFVSLLSGHIGGANRLAEQCAAVSAGKAVISTASDLRHLPALDEIADRWHYFLRNPEKTASAAKALFAGETLDLLVPDEIFQEEFAPFSAMFRRIDAPGQIRAKTAVLFLHNPIPVPEEGNNSIVLQAVPKEITLGIGCRKGVTAEQIEETVRNALREMHGDLRHVVSIATADFKCGEEGLVQFCRNHRLALRGFSAEELNKCDVPHKSPKAEECFGVHSVCEAAAMLGAGTERLCLFKFKGNGVTVAAAEHAVPGKGNA